MHSKKTLRNIMILHIDPNSYPLDQVETLNISDLTEFIYHEHCETYVVRLCILLERMNYLKKIKLTGKSPGDDNLLKIFNTIKNVNNLTCLVIESILFMNEEILPKITEILKYSTKFKKLGFRNFRPTKMGAESIAQLIKQNNTLEKLEFVESFFDEETIPIIVKAIRKCDTITHLNINNRFYDGIWDLSSMFLVLANSKNLLTLDISYGRYTSETLISLCEFIKQNISLEKLFFNNVDFDFHSIDLIFTSVCENSNLKTLIFGENRLFNKNLASLCLMIKKNKTLKSLYLPECFLFNNGVEIQILCEALSLNSCLTFVDLSYNNIKSKDFYKICNMIERNQTIECLIYQTDEINSLQNNIDNNCVELLIGALKINRTLTSFYCKHDFSSKIESRNKVYFLLESNLQWTLENHHQCYPTFKKVVFTFLIVLKIFYKNNNNIKIPKPLIHLIIRTIDKKSFFEIEFQKNSDYDPNKKRKRQTSQYF